jgi:hypothetical protein
VSPKVGLLESAAGGTVFLDEVGELPAAVQVTLLRVLEERRVTPVGAVRARPIDVRFIAATNRHLEGCVAAGTFREDLYFRLAGISLEVPPLRERAEEIDALARLFLEEACARARIRPTPTLDEGALRALREHRWPGNLRELRNTMERAALFATDGVLQGGAPRRGALARGPREARRDGAPGRASGRGERGDPRGAERLRGQPDARRRPAGHLAAHAGRPAHGLRDHPPAQVSHGRSPRRDAGARVHPIRRWGRARARACGAILHRRSRRGRGCAWGARGSRTCRRRPRSGTPRQGAQGGSQSAQAAPPRVLRVAPTSSAVIRRGFTKVIGHSPGRGVSSDAPIPDCTSGAVHECPQNHAHPA